VTVLQIEGVSKTYKGKKGKKVHALSDLDLRIGTGEVFGFLGPNGAGKSTTLKILMGQIRPTAGMAYLFGSPVSDPASRKRVGYLPENPAFYDFMTAREYLRFVGRAFGMNEDRVSGRMEETLTLLELQDAADRPIRGFSKGMVQRLGLAQALLHDPDLFIFDEPMSGLDPLGRALVKNIIAELKMAGKTVFFSTHITDDVEAVCDRVGIIVAGRLQTINTVKDILQHGVEGYRVTVSKIARISLPEYEVLNETPEGMELFVDRDRIRHFMGEVSRIDGSVELIEPRRRNLQAFFLDIVAKGGNESQ
jgi:ABC-2 type transport system ATP-binding protein